MRQLSAILGRDGTHDDDHRAWVKVRENAVLASKNGIGLRFINNDTHDDAGLIC